MEVCGVGRCWDIFMGVFGKKMTKTLKKILITDYMKGKKKQDCKVDEWEGREKMERENEEEVKKPE